MEGAEEAGRSRDGDRDESEFSKDLLPAFAGDPCGGCEFTEDLSQLHLAVGRKLDGLADGVDEPTKDDFARPPTAVSFEELLEGNGFIAFVRGDVRHS